MNLGNFVCRAEEIYLVTNTRSKIKQYKLELNIQLCGKKKHSNCTTDVMVIIIRLQ